VQAQKPRYQETRTGIVGFSSTVRFSTGSRAGGRDKTEPEKKTY